MASHTRASNLTRRIEKQHIGEGQELLQPPFDRAGVEVCVLQAIEQRIALSPLNAVSALLNSNQANPLLKQRQSKGPHTAIGIDQHIP